MSPALQAAIDAFAAEHRAHYEDCETARDMCGVASQDFIDTAPEGLSLEKVDGFIMLGNVIMTGHTAVLAESMVIDFTARQFNPQADYPQITPVAEWRKTWQPLPGPEPLHTFTFRVEDGPMWRHREPGTWLEDLVRVAGLDATRLTATTERLVGGRWLDVEVIGTADLLRFACVALNLHAEQAPWDGTPPEQAAALDALLATFPPADSLGRDGYDEHDSALAQHLLDRHGFGPEVYNLGTLARLSAHENAESDHTHRP